MKFSYGKTFLLGFGYLGVIAIWSIYTAFVPTILEKKFLLPLQWIAFFMTLDNIAALVIQPLAGVWSDKTRTSIGRRMPFILFGAPISAFAFAALPVAPILPLFVVCTTTLLASMALWRTPVMALVADVTPSPLRSQASGVISVMGGLGGMIAYFGGGRLAKINPAYPFWLGAAVVVMAALALFIGVKEPRQPAVEEASETTPGIVASIRELIERPDRSTLCLVGALFLLTVGYSAVEGFFSLYATNHLGLSVGDSALLLGQCLLVFVFFSVPSGLLAGKFSRRAIVMAGLLLMSAVLIAVFLLPAATLLHVLIRVPVLGEVPVLGALLMLVGVAWALVIIHPLPMLSDMTDASRIGTYTGLYYLFTSLAAIAGPILNGWIVQSSGGNYNTVMLFAPATLMLAWGLMWGVKNTSHAQFSPSKPFNG